MTNVAALFNIFFSLISWKWSMEAFQLNRNFLGWTQLILSAVNASAAASAIF